MNNDKDNNGKLKFTNKTVVKTVRDKRGNVTTVSVENVISFPKSKYMKSRIDFKLWLERQIADCKISPYIANEIWKAIKLPKAKYKQYHWYIGHSGECVDVLSPKVASNGIRAILCAYKKREEMNLPDKSILILKDMLLNRIWDYVISYPLQLELLGDDIRINIVENYMLKSKVNMNTYLNMRERAIQKQKDDELIQDVVR